MHVFDGLIPSLKPRSRYSRFLPESLHLGELDDFLMLAAVASRLDKSDRNLKSGYPSEISSAQYCQYGYL